VQPCDIGAGDAGDIHASESGLDMCPHPAAVEVRGARFAPGRHFSEPNPGKRLDRLPGASAFLLEGIGSGTDQGQQSDRFCSRLRGCEYAMPADDHASLATGTAITNTIFQEVRARASRADMQAKALQLGVEPAAGTGGFD
jgi:hypothetical protein